MQNNYEFLINKIRNNKIFQVIRCNIYFSMNNKTSFGYFHVNRFEIPSLALRILFDKPQFYSEILT